MVDLAREPSGTAPVIADGLELVPPQEQEVLAEEEVLGLTLSEELMGVVAVVAAYAPDQQRVGFEAAEYKSGFRSDILEINGWAEMEEDGEGARDLNILADALGSFIFDKQVPEDKPAMLKLVTAQGVTDITYDEDEDGRVRQMHVEGEWSVRRAVDTGKLWIKHESVKHRNERNKHKANEMFDVISVIAEEVGKGRGHYFVAQIAGEYHKLQVGELDDEAVQQLLAVIAPEHIEEITGYSSLEVEDHYRHNNEQRRESLQRIKSRHPDKSVLEVLKEAA